MPQQLTQILVEPDHFHVSPEPMLLVAEVQAAMAVCLHDERRKVGGLWHVRFIGDSGRPTDVTDNTLSSILVVLDRFKRAVLGNGAGGSDVQARIIAHALPPTDESEPSATLVDLIKADLADLQIDCGTETLRRLSSIRVCFEPFAGRIWISGPGNMRPMPQVRSSTG